MSNLEIYIILGFFLTILIGISLVSIHYRKKYEELKIHNKRLRNLVYNYEEVIKNV